MLFFAASITIYLVLMLVIMIVLMVMLVIMARVVPMIIMVVRVVLLMGYGHTKDYDNPIKNDLKYLLTVMIVYRKANVVCLDYV